MDEALDKSMDNQVQRTTTRTTVVADWSGFKRLLAEAKLSGMLLDSRNDLDKSILVTSSPTLVHILTRKTVLWARESLEKLPIRLTLENVGAFAILLAIIMPRAITYTLTYPLFRLVFGTLYPAYASYKAVRTKNVKEYVKWMMYWIVFALFTCAETVTDVFFSFWFPFYYEIKIVMVLWLLSPATKGSSILYRRFVHPALCRREAEIDEALARATEQGYSAVLQLGSKGVNYATTVLMQTAIKNLPNVMASGATSAGKSDSAISSSASRDRTDSAGSSPPSPGAKDSNKCERTHPTIQRKSRPSSGRLSEIPISDDNDFNYLDDMDTTDELAFNSDHLDNTENLVFDPNYFIMEPIREGPVDLTGFSEFKGTLANLHAEIQITRRKPLTRAQARNSALETTDDS